MNGLDANCPALTIVRVPPLAQRADRRRLAADNAPCEILAAETKDVADRHRVARKVKTWAVQFESSGSNRNFPVYRDRSWISPAI